MAVIGSISVNVLAAKLDKFEQDMRRGARSTETMAKRSEVAMRRVGVAIKSLTGLIVGGALLNSFKSITADIDKLAKTSDKLGITTQKLAGLRHAGEQTGVAINTMDMALQRMVRRVAEAAQGTGEAVKALDELGINAQELSKLSPDQQFAMIADAMKGVTSQADKVRLAFKLFDSEGVALINTLDLGTKGLNAMQSEANKLGLAISRVEAKKIEQFNDTLDRLQKLAGSGLRDFVIDVSPDLMEAAKLLSGAARLLGKGAKASRNAFGAVFDGIVDSDAVQRQQRQRDRARMSAIAANVDPRALGFHTRGQVSSGEQRRIDGKAQLKKTAELDHIEKLKLNGLFPNLERAAAPFANRESGAKIASSAGKVGKALAESMGAGLGNVYKRFRYDHTPLGALGAATGIPIEDMISGKRPNKARDREREVGNLSAVSGRSAQGFSALRQNIKGNDLAERSLKELRMIAKNTKKSSDAKVREVGI